MNQNNHYNRAVGVAKYIIEGHTIEQTKEEFRISNATIERDLAFLGSYGYGEKLEENFKLYKKAKIQLYKNRHKK